MHSHEHAFDLIYDLFFCFVGNEYVSLCVVPQI